MAVKVTKNHAEEMILHHLLTKTSAAFREKFDKSEKSIAGCMNYIMSEARKQAQGNQACIPDDEVFGWAVHYFEEDTIRQETYYHGKVEVAESHSKTAEKPRPLHNPIPAKKDPEERQLSLFDLAEA